MSPIQTMVQGISQVSHMEVLVSGMQPYLTRAMVQAA